MIKQYHTWKRRITAFALALAMLFSMMPTATSSAAKKVSLDKKKLTITVGKSKKLKLKNNKKKVSWTVTSGKKNIQLKAKKKTGVTIVAKKKGKAKVQAKVGKKKYTCTVTVVKKVTPEPQETVTPSAQTSADPNATADVTASGQPSGTMNPGSSNQPTQNPGSSEQPTQTPGSSEQPTQTPGSSSQPTQTPTGTPGGEIDLGGKTAFNIGAKKLALGISRDEVLQVIGSATRTEKSPQGFDVIVYNPGGTYNGYTLIYLKDNVVVSLCAIGSAGTVSYGNLVKTGDSASTLEGTSGWKGDPWFAAKDGESKDGEGAYKYTASNPNATVLAYVDYYRKKGNTVYCIQAYSNTISMDEMIYPAECEYNTEILNAIKLETTELLIAYRTAVVSGLPQNYPLYSVDGLITAAQNYLNSCPKGSDSPPDIQNSTALKAEVLKQNGNDAPMHFAQITMSGSSDSIGFANSALEQKTASDYIINLSHTVTNSNGPASKYFYQYFGIAAADDGNHHTYMVIDLVDLWYNDADVDDDYE